jgi:hypothetical protein
VYDDLYVITDIRFIRRLIAERRIEFVKVGRHVRISEPPWPSSSRRAARGGRGRSEDR